ncbi:MULTISPECIES: hypothetical protein [Photorhabdus]|nr:MULTISPECIES: hypothetical protein [Photorhabdus]
MNEAKENEIYLHPEYDECGRPYYNVSFSCRGNGEQSKIETR